MPEPVKMLDKPFWVCHTNGDVVASFSDQQSAEDDAKERNQQAVEMKLSCRYTSKPKP